MKNGIVLLLILLSGSILAQPFTLVKKIGEGIPNNQSGLSQSFHGKVLQDGNLYFLGSHDGLVRDLWRSDGTPSGTIKVLSEGSPGFWETVDFVHEGVFIGAGDNLLWYKAGMLPVRNLGQFEDETFIVAEKMDSSHYIILTHKDTNAALMVTDLTAAGTYSLGTIGMFNGFLTLYAGPYGAVIYNTNPFVLYEPMLFEFESGLVMSVKDYLAPYMTVSAVHSVAMHQHYLLLDVSAGGRKRYTFDMRTHTFYSGNNFFGTVQAFYPYQDDIIVVSEREIARLDTTTYLITEYTDQVYPLGTHYLHGDQLYFHGYSEGDTVYVHSMDLNSNKITRLPDGQIGKFYYHSRFAFHENELYYLRDFGPTTCLTRYDFADSVAVDIDSINVRNGGLVITNAISEVKGQLLVSKFSPEEWHELYYLDETNRLSSVEFNPVGVFPNPCSDRMYIDLDEKIGGDIWIFDVMGQMVTHSKLNQDYIHSGSLKAGVYYGILQTKGAGYCFSFVKQ